MLTREDIFKHVKENYGTTPDYPWDKFPKYAALRHESSEKWYGLIMNVHPKKLGLDGNEKIDILNVKCPPEVSDSIKNEKNILPGYHMDKEHWISLVLEPNNPKDEIYNLLKQSYNLTK